MGAPRRRCGRGGRGGGRGGGRRHALVSAPHERGDRAPDWLRPRVQVPIPRPGVRRAPGLGGRQGAGAHPGHARGIPGMWFSLAVCPRWPALRRSEMGDSSGSLGAACEEEPGAEGGLRGGAVPLHKQVRNVRMPMPCRWGCVHGEVLEAHIAFVQVREQSSGRTPAPRTCRSCCAPG